MRLTAWLAGLLWLLTVGLVLVGLMFAFPNEAAQPGKYPMPWPEVAISIIFATLGAFIAFFRPTNRIGWLYSVVGLLAGLLVASGGYGTYGVETVPGSLPAAVAAYWINGWVWAPALVLVSTFCLLLFPDGQLPSRRWRPVAWLAIVALVLITLGAAVMPWPPPSAIENPLRLDEVGGVSTTTIFNIAVIPFVTSTLASLISLFVRFWRAQGAERQQLKWVAYAALMAAFLEFLGSYVSDVIPNSLIRAIEYSLVAAAIVIAILRYRLYDIDIIINRTLVYGTLTALLAAIYFASVVLLQRLLMPFIGASEQITIVASTLAIAALFNPLRRSIQAIINRRFYRRKYDAQKTLQGFSARLREETNLDQLTADLVTVVEQTMQPTHVSVWLREPTHTSEGRIL